MKVADLTEEQLQTLIRRTLEDVLAERFDETEALVERVVASIQSGDRGLPLEEAARALGLDW